MFDLEPQLTDDEINVLSPDIEYVITKEIRDVRTCNWSDTIFSTGNKQEAIEYVMKLVGNGLYPDWDSYDVEIWHVNINEEEPTETITAFKFCGLNILG